MGLETSFADYIQTLSKPGNWGDYRAISAASVMLEIRFTIVSPVSTYTLAPDDTEGWPTVHIGHLVDLHFLSLDEASDQSKYLLHGYPHHNQPLRVLAKTA